MPAALICTQVNTSRCSGTSPSGAASVPTADTHTASEWPPLGRLLADKSKCASRPGPAS